MSFLLLLGRLSKQMKRRRRLLQHGAEPLLSFVHRDVLAGSVRNHLVLRDLAHCEILTALPGEVQPAHSSCGLHSEALRQADACLRLDVHQLPHGLLFQVVWLRGVARGRANTCADSRGSRKNVQILT